MKTLTTLAALLIAGASAYANVGNNYNVDPKKTVAIIHNVQAKYKLVYLKDDRGSVKINITNENGDRIHSQTVSNVDGFSQQFDFSTLPFGSYTFEVTHPDGSTVSEIVKHEKPEITPESSQLKANILNVNGDKKFRLAVLKSSDSPVNVKIFDENDRLLHQEVISGNEGFRKVYDLKDINASTFKFEISDNNSAVTVLSN